MDRPYVILRWRCRQDALKCQTEDVARDVLYRQRLRREVHQCKVLLSDNLNVFPQTLQRVELKDSVRRNSVHVVVMQKIEDDILLESRTEQSGQTDNPCREA